jgi:hypothetical protein
MWNKVPSTNVTACDSMTLLQLYIILRHNVEEYYEWRQAANLEQLVHTLSRVYLT